MENVSSDRVPEFSLGERIRKAREDLGLSQQEFADLLGADRKTIGNWEAMRTHPRYGDLMLISSVADVSLEWLAGELFRRHEPMGAPAPRPPRIRRSRAAAGARDSTDTGQEAGRNSRWYADTLVAA